MRPPDKPRLGSPCNGCGACCIAERCIMGELVAGPGPGPGPLLIERPDGPGFACGVVVDPARYAPRHAARDGVEAIRAAATSILGVGVGCDSNDGDNTFVEIVRMKQAIRRAIGAIDNRPANVFAFRPMVEDLRAGEEAAVAGYLLILNVVPPRASLRIYAPELFEETDDGARRSLSGI